MPENTSYYASDFVYNNKTNYILSNCIDNIFNFLHPSPLVVKLNITKAQF